ncbi:hypothetical protein SETIT_9G443100v2 [Setaria italica]|uniref:Uncharacterized protein n=1 Tax=Setaria italica TaxID=4555 RepID=A0A368SSD6_SETIT|nr:hypothetical protein SETIT_9G443100v2 [Setaria italica]
MTTSTLLLKFATSQLRNRVLDYGGLVAGRTALCLMLWTHQVSASASKVLYRVRVCIEGIDNVRETEKEKDCFCLWLWIANPTGIAKTDSLKIEKLLTFPEEFYMRFGNEMLTQRTGAVEMLNYKVIIRLDRVLDYLPLPSSPSYQSYESNISGLLDDELEREWPTRHRFVWHYSVPDGGATGWRVAVHECLGSIRDPSSSRGGGFGGRGHTQLPSPSWHDLDQVRRRGLHQGNGSNVGKTWYQGR